MNTRHTNTVVPRPPSTPNPQRTAPLLLDDQPLILLPKLAVVLGLNEAIIVQQLHFLLRNERNGRLVDGHRWIYRTYEEWQAEFPWWSTKTIARTFQGLEANHVINSCQPEGVQSRRKYYRLNSGMVARLLSGNLPLPDTLPDTPEQEDSLSDAKRTSCPLPSTETTLQRSLKKSKESTTCVVAKKLSRFPETEDKRSRLSKEEKLSRLRVLTDFPSEDDFEQFLSDHAPAVLLYRNDLYRDLCVSKWHAWRNDRWVAIRDWRKFVLGLERTLEKQM